MELEAAVSNVRLRTLARVHAHVVPGMPCHAASCLACAPDMGTIAEGPEAVRAPLCLPSWHLHNTGAPAIAASAGETA